MKLFFAKFSICLFGLMLSLLLGEPILRLFENEPFTTYDFNDWLRANYYYSLWGYFSGLYIFTFIAPFLYGQNVRSFTFNIFVLSQLAFFVVFISPQEVRSTFRTLANALPNILAVGFVLKWNFEARSTD